MYNYWYVITELKNWCQNSKCPLCTFFHSVLPNYKDVKKLYPLVNEKTIKVIGCCEKKKKIVV